MKIYFKSLLFLVILSLTFSLHSSQNNFKTSSSIIYCSPQLQKCLETILKVPEGRNLVNAVRKEGSFQIIAISTLLSKQFGAYWDPDHRMIFLNFSPHESDGSLIGSLLFELHNALVNSEINQLNQQAKDRKISKKDYVESMEYLEYKNSLNASKLSQIGINLGIFPNDSYLPTYKSFKEHLEAQKMSGHSDYFSHNFDLCQPF